MRAQNGRNRYPTLVGIFRGPCRPYPHITYPSSLQCLKVISGTLRGGTTEVRITYRSNQPSSNLKNLSKIVGNQTQSAPNQLSNEPIFADSSGPFFTLYSEAAEEEDNKMVKGWQENAKGILIFVSPCVPIRSYVLYENGTPDRFILCHSRCTRHCDRSRPEAEQSRYLRILSWQHL